MPKRRSPAERERYRLKIYAGVADQAELYRALTEISLRRRQAWLRSMLYDGLACATTHVPRHRVKASSESPFVTIDIHLNRAEPLDMDVIEYIEASAPAFRFLRIVDLLTNGVASKRQAQSTQPVVEEHSTMRGSSNGASLGPLYADRATPLRSATRKVSGGTSRPRNTTSPGRPVRPDAPSRPIHASRTEKQTASAKQTPVSAQQTDAPPFDLPQATSEPANEDSPPPDKYRDLFN